MKLAAQLEILKEGNISPPPSHQPERWPGIEDQYDQRTLPMLPELVEPEDTISDAMLKTAIRQWPRTQGRAAARKAIKKKVLTLGILYSLFYIVIVFPHAVLGSQSVCSRGSGI